MSIPLQSDGLVYRKPSDVDPVGIQLLLASLCGKSVVSFPTTSRFNPSRVVFVSWDSKTVCFEGPLWETIMVYLESLQDQYIWEMNTTSQNNLTALIQALEE